MSNIAILIGNTDYTNLNQLSCCHDDLLAMKQLLEAADKYSEIGFVENVDADTLRTQIRAIIEKRTLPTNEVFFYFTGHGYAHEAEFFFCATNFDQARPNQTGLSIVDLHALLKLADAQLVVTVIDACYSGTRLLKGESPIPPRREHPFRNLIQISSCLDSQESMAGSPLSVFTEKFRRAALSKERGIVYYMDVINALRDEFVESETQIPFFVSQVTGREQFVEDGERFIALRTTLQAIAIPAAPARLEDPLSPEPTTLLTRLQLAESKLAKRTSMEAFIGKFFDGLRGQLTINHFEDYYDSSIDEFHDFSAPTASEFITKILSQEKRLDDFVTAEITRKRKRKTWLDAAYLSSMYLPSDDDYIKEHHLMLNCSLPRVELKITLTPKFSVLKRIVLVVTCAPSLECCYVFEVATVHSLTDFAKFDDYGTEVVSRWYKAQWDRDSAEIADKILVELETLLRAHLDRADKRF